MWNQTVDEFGDVDGPNVLRLAAPSGSVVITFNTTNSVKAHPRAHGTFYYPHAQRLYAGTGAYTGTTESGMIDLTTNHARNEVTSLMLTSANS